MNDRIDKETGEVLDGDATVELFGPDGESLTGGPISDAEFKRRVQRIVEKDNPKLAEGFALEPSEPGHVPDRVINELRNARATAKDYATAFNDCVKAQAEKYSVKPGALKRYIVALEEDKLEEVDAETDDLARLIGSS